MYRIAGAASVSVGAFVTITSVVGAVLGAQGLNGWLAILYGALGASMGVAGMVGVWTKGSLRSALLGWFLVGAAIRAIVDGNLLWYVGFPVAVVLLSALATELIRRRFVPGTLWAAAGGGLATLSIVALAFAAPYLPVTCPPVPEPGKSVTYLSYPGNVPPWDTAEQKYAQQCLEADRKGSRGHR